MFIKELILDGFKSYATRTVISGWDCEFNAITGLNGSGKSNILDAICFVLGISNLTQVRAQNLQDLVYKRGQAGITKASVTLVFDNSDALHSPVGFEQCPLITVTRQIVIGGRNKYLINGHVAQLQAISNLFQSVQLNINNPHFLIMQGRITKVLNMKPPEILAMIEEAAGTRMFEEKKDKALKTILKKDQKLQEITEIMEKDIAPKLEKLKKEKSDFMAFQKIEGEVERLRRFIIAYDYTKSQQKLNQSESDLLGKQQAIKDMERRLKDLSKELKQIQMDEDQVGKEKQKELKKKTQFQQLQSSVGELANQLTRLGAQMELKLSGVREEESTIAKTRTTQNELEQQRNNARAELDIKEHSFAEFKKRMDQESVAVKKQEEFLQTLTTGIAANEGEENGYAEQIDAVRAEKMEMITRAEVAKNRMGFLKEGVLKGKVGLAKLAEKEMKEVRGQWDGLKREIEEIKVRRMEVQFDPTKESALKSQKEKCRQELEYVQEELDMISGQLSNIHFQYSDPYKGFDRSKVKGLIAKLIKLDTSKLDYCTALQVCAEGRLYYVVVDDNQVASDILTKGQLKRKYTIIPLKQIQPNSVGADRVQAARALSPGKIEYALSLVGYDKEVERAMEYVFGSTLICKDAKSAKAAAYDSKVRMRAITLDGDVYEPGATITGGSKPNRNNDILVKLHQLAEVEAKYAQASRAYEEACRALEAYDEIAVVVRELDQQLRRKEYEFTSLEKVMRESPAGRLLAEVEDAKRELVELESVIKECTQKQFACDKKVKELEREMKEFSGDREGKIKKLEKEVQKAKKDLLNSEQKFKNERRLLTEAQQDYQQLVEEAGQLEAQIVSSEEAIAKLELEMKQLSKEIASVKSEYDVANEELSRQSIRFQRFDDELKELEEKRKSATEESEELEIEVKKLSHEVQLFHQEKLAAEETVNKILEEHDWIMDQRSNFGKANTAFDFSAQNPNECRKRLKQLEQEHDSLRKRINVKVMNMIDRVVTKEKSLKQMLATVCRDKSKIEETIQQLEHYKKEALMRTWTKVNSDFGAIFDELLPGNTAKLDVPEGLTITDGLEVKVCLGGVWKQSLTELSGGQRSLVALSLILSLLQFKPAPMYILDEIDAALDLSHTQNIGHLFKNRFKGSQFIVVSLKEGMFNNANVLFKARFRDGTSIVERFTQGQLPPPEAPAGNKKSKGSQQKENQDGNVTKGGAAAAKSKRSRTARPQEGVDEIEA